jgi:hypothetical protein
VLIGVDFFEMFDMRRDEREVIDVGDEMRQGEMRYGIAQDEGWYC